MSKSNLGKKALIEYILKHNPALKKEELENQTIRALVLIKMHIEINQAKKNNDLSL